jgi:hypothetical protein
LPPERNGSARPPGPAEKGGCALLRERANCGEAAPLGGSGSSGGGGGAQLAAHPLFAPLRDAVAAHGHTRRWLERLPRSL